MNKRRFLTGLGVLLVAIIGYAAYYLVDAMPIGTGHTAKYVCSKVFLGNQDPERVFNVELEPSNPLFTLVDFRVDRAAETVTAKGPGGLKPATAVFRNGFGCTLTTDTTREELLTQVEGIAPPPQADMTGEWPAGERVNLAQIPPEVDREKLKAVVEDAFREPLPDSSRNTHAVVIVYRGRIIAEHYADGITHTTPLLGWSMTKSWINALIGLLVKDGKLDIMKAAPVQAWRNDERRSITIDQLLRMSSGLEFEEVYAPGSDAVNMFYKSRSFADFAANMPLEAAPDSRWSYSSGTTNILSGIVFDAVGGTLRDLNRFTRERLFDRIGMHSALIEPDPSGNWVGSSYGFATARDWARFGLLYLNDGVWNGERILPEGWVSYSSTPTPLAEQGKYGAQFWLNAGENGKPETRRFPSVPADQYNQGGYNGQLVAVIPSRDLVIVRLGVTLDDSWSHERFMAAVIDCIAD